MEFNREEAKETLKERNIDFKGNASNEVLKELLATEEVVAPVVEVEGETTRTFEQGGKIYKKTYNKNGDSVSCVEVV